MLVDVAQPIRVNASVPGETTGVRPAWYPSDAASREYCCRQTPFGSRNTDISTTREIVLMTDSDTASRIVNDAGDGGRAH